MANGKILLVEGTDDEHVLKHICGKRGIPPLDEVKPHGGDTKLLESLEVRLKLPEDGDVIGVVIDADTKISKRWQSIRNLITKFGYQDVPNRGSGRRVPAGGSRIVPAGSG